jgi:hypothetical protein
VRRAAGCVFPPKGDYRRDRVYGEGVLASAQNATGWVVIVLIAAGVLYGLWYGYVRPRQMTRACPVCARRVLKGRTQCPHCGADYTAPFRG